MFLFKKKEPKIIYTYQPSEVDLLFKEYKPILDKHFELLHKAQNEYSIAINQEDIFNEYTTQCKYTCLEDIKLAPKFKEYYDKNSVLGGNKEKNTFYGAYPTYTIFAKLCEKEGLIRDAILMCVNAIQMGFIIESNKSTIEGRLARLIKKYNNDNYSEKLHFDYENKILFDENSGEIIK